MTCADPELLDLPWEDTATYTLDPAVNLPGEGALIFPTGLSPGKLRAMSIYTTPKIRRFLVQCGSAKYVESYSMSLPRTVKVFNVPQDLHFKSQTLKYVANYVFKNYLLKASRQLITDRKGRICDANDDAQWSAMTTVMKRDLRQQVLFN